MRFLSWDMPVSDIVHGLRFLRRKPGFTIAAVLSLALGIGATTAVFTMLNAVALRPLPYADPARLVWMTQLVKMNSTDEVTITPDFLDWRRLTRKFTDLAAFNYATRNLTGFTHPLELRTARVSASLLPLLGIPVTIGRNFSPEEDYKGRDAVAIIGNEMWQSVFGGEANVTQRAIALDGRSYRIIGVLPRGFVFPGPQPADLLTPLAKDEAAELQRANSVSIVTNIIGRLKPSVRLEEARAELESIQSHLPALAAHASITIKMLPLRERLYGNAKAAGLLLTLAAGFLLLIACANVGNLLLVRLLQRDREMAIRAALGGSRARLVRQLLAENALLGGLACGLGILLAYGLRAPLIALSPYQLPGMEQLPFDWRVLAFAAGAGMLATLLFGFAPAWRATDVHLADAIKSGATTITGGRGSLRRLSVVAVGEIAVMLALATGAGLTIESFWKMRYVDVGFQPDHLTAATLNLSRAHARVFLEQLLERAQGLPGLESAAITTDLPPGSFRAAQNSFGIEGQDFATGQRPMGRYPAVSADYFRTMGIRLIRGRLIEESDTETAAPVAVVNQALARRFFPNGAIGRRVRTSGVEWSTIIGIAGDVKTDGLASSVQPTIYFPYRQTGAAGTVEIVMRSRLGADKMGSALRSVVAELDAAQPVSNITTMDERLTESAARPRFTAALLGAFACLAMALGIIGVYGVMSCRVRWQLRELAVRHALGAQAWDISALILRQGMSIIAPGLVLGIAGSLVVGRALSGMLYRVAPDDPAMLAIAAAALGITALAACWIPASRAARVDDPMAAMRED